MKNFCYQVVNMLKILALRIFFDHEARELTLHSETGWTPISRTIQVWVYGAYRDERNLDLLQRLKYTHDVAAQEFCANLIANFVKTQYQVPPLCIGVPQSTHRKLWRGYDHIGELVALLATQGRVISLSKSHPFIHNSSAPTQSSLQRKERFANAQSAFSLSPDFDPNDITGREVLLIDDIVTTGATLAYLQELLYSCGAKRVVALAILG
jgi:ComF family protein